MTTSIFTNKKTRLKQTGHKKSKAMKTKFFFSDW